MIFNSSLLSEPPVKPRLLAGVQAENSYRLNNYSGENSYPVAGRIIPGDTYPGELRTILNKSGLRERGCDQKQIQWTNSDCGGYLVVNGSEFEPGSFKERLLMEENPHLILEGIVLAAYALKIKKCFIYLRAGYKKAYLRLKNALQEAINAGLAGENIFGTTINCPVEIIRGGDAFICNNKTALLNSLQANRPYPQATTPGTEREIFGDPAAVHNIETLGLVPYIFDNNPGWLKKWGTEENPGFRLFCVSGAVNRPGVYEAPADMDNKILVDKYCEGSGSSRLKALLPGGIFSSAPVKNYKNTSPNPNGAGNIIAIPRGSCMVKLTRRIAEFYARQACGYCVAGRDGISRLARSLNRLEKGEKYLFTPEKMEDLCLTIKQNAFCSQGIRGANLILEIARGWPREFEHHYHKKCCDLK